MRLPAILLLLTASACVDMRASRRRHRPPNPYPDIRRVAVLPVANMTSAEFDAEEFANAIADELLAFDGFEVIRPAQVRQAAGGTPLKTIEDVLKLVGQLDADALIAASVTSYDPYHPPKMSLSLQMIRARSSGRGGRDVDRLVRSRSWREPIELSRERAGHVAAAFEETYDTHADRVRDEVAAFSRVHVEEDTGFSEGDEYLFVQRRFRQFVACQALFQMIESAAKNGEEAPPPAKDAPERLDPGLPRPSAH
jgi:hypothetical protein